MISIKDAFSPHNFMPYPNRFSNGNKLPEWNPWVCYLCEEKLFHKNHDVELVHDSEPGLWFRAKAWLSRLVGQ